MNQLQYSILESCGQGTVDILNAVMQDPSKQFMNGQSTTPFTDTVDAGTNLATTLYGNTMNVLNQSINIKESTMGPIDTASSINYSQVIKETAENIVSSATSFVKTEIEQYGNYKKQQLIDYGASLPSYFAQRTAYWTKEYAIEEIKKAKEAHIKDNDKSVKDESDEMTKRSATEVMNDISKKSAYITSKITDVMKIVDKDINNITTYITVGPQWIETNINKTIRKTVGAIENELDIMTNEAYSEARNTLDGLAEGIGRTAAQRSAEGIKDAAKKELNKVSKSTATAKSFAKSALQIIKQKAAALAGL